MCVPGERGDTSPLRAFTGFLMCSLSAPLQPLSHLSLLSQPEGADGCQRSTASLLLVLSCCLSACRASSSSLGRRAAVGRDTTQSSSIFMFLWISVKCRAESDTTAEDCLPLGPTPHLSALIVRLMEWVYRNCLCSVQFKVSERWRRRAVNHIWNTHFTWGVSDEMFGEGVITVREHILYQAV